VLVIVAIQYLFCIKVDLVAISFRVVLDEEFVDIVIDCITEEVCDDVVFRDAFGGEEAISNGNVVVFASGTMSA